MEANGLTRCSLPYSFESPVVCDEMITDDGASASTPPSRDPAAMTTDAMPPAPISPCGSPKRYSPSFVSSLNDQVARYCSNECVQRRCGTAAMRTVCNNVAVAQTRVRQIEDHLVAGQQQGHGSPASLRDQLFAEKIRLIDALVVMGWEHYRCFLEESECFEKAEAAVRHIYEEALELSVELFCSAPPATGTSISNNGRLMMLLLTLDFDEYCESLLGYQLARESTSASLTSVSNGADAAAGVRGADGRLAEILKPAAQGNAYLQQVHELWKTGAFERFDVAASHEEEEHLAKIHAAGLCLVLFRKLEYKQTDLKATERQFRYLFDEYLPRQLAQPSMNNIIATKHARILFQDGTPTVYWSLLADSYRKEWAEHLEGYGSGAAEELFDMDMDEDEDDEDDGL